MNAMLLVIISILWIIWGLVHAAAGVLTIMGDASSGFAAIADGVEPSLLAMDYHPAVDAVLNQHAYNLLWFGLFTIIGALFIWRGNVVMLLMTALVGGLADIGYFVFLDLGGFVKFFPGTVMTIVSGSAILLSILAYLSRGGSEEA